MVTIVISSYDNGPFFKDLFDSIGSQTYRQFSVLIGTDGSLSDRTWLREHAGEYTVVNYIDNKGPYITFNTLVQQVTTPYILFFGADDVMCSDLLSRVMNAGYYDVIRFGFTEFGTKPRSGVFYPAHGSFLIKTEVFRSLNGFYDWRCSADSEFMHRLKSKGFTELVIKEGLFSYRRHEKSLTIAEKTSLTSGFRKQYSHIINDCQRRRTWNNPKSYITRTDILTDV